MKTLKGKLRKYHKWTSIILIFFTLIFALSGIVLNHRGFFSDFDIPRKYLLDEYRYKNWNNAAVKSSLQISPDSVLVYGNIGIWLTDSLFNDFRDFNSGLAKGIDNRKIFKIHKTDRGNLYAGTLFGLFRYDKKLMKWHHVESPFGNEEVQDILHRNDTLYVLTRSYLFVAPDSPESLNFLRVTIPPPADYDNKESLFKTLWVIHSGEIGGIVGKLVVDLIGLTFIFLSITGVIYWLFPKWIKRRKQNELPIENIKLINRFSAKWHNKFGVWLIALLIITTLTGMFLRPPLLITIATATVGKIPFTLLDNSNPWYDKLRKIIFDEKKDRFLIGTNMGIFASDKHFRDELQLLSVQPLISVMGINVFEKFDENGYLVGSFNGLFLWNPDRYLLMDFLNPGKNTKASGSVSPIGKNMTTGLIKSCSGDIWHFDYNRGAEIIKGKQFRDMPEQIIQQSPMSLWNLALELHTGRYYSFLFGKLYILFIPLFGITMLVILISGLWLWLRIKKDVTRIRG